jgi:hypothetical protein
LTSWTGDLGLSTDLVIAEIKSGYAKIVGKSHSVSDSWSYTAEEVSNTTATFPVKHHDHLWILVGRE